MATISKLPSGSWRVQVRRKGHYISESFLRRGDAELWARTIEGKIDRGEVDKLIRLLSDERELLLEKLGGSSKRT